MMKIFKPMRNAAGFAAFLLLVVMAGWAVSQPYGGGGTNTYGLNILYCPDPANAGQYKPCGVGSPLSIVGAELPTDSTGTFTNATQTTSITATGLDGYGTALVSINGTYAAAAGVFEVSDDGGTTWYAIQGTRLNACVVENNYTGLTNLSQAWIISISGADQFRVRSTAVTSGTANVRVSISSATPPNNSAACIGNQYPNGATPLTASATGTTGATTATLAGVAGKTTYLCGFSIRANATAAATGTATVTGIITGTLSFVQWTAALASGIGITEPPLGSTCIPASGTNQAIAVISAAPGSGGTVSVAAWGYQL